MGELSDIKKDLFYRLLDDAGRVFIHVRPSMELEIGRRGLVGEELNNGITLVFNSHMNFDWGDFGIEVTLVFGTTPEKCFIPAEAIEAVYSPELKVQLLTEQVEGEGDRKGKQVSEEKERPSEHQAVTAKVDGKVIEVDFHRKKDH